MAKPAAIQPVSQDDLVRKMIIADPGVGKTSYWATGAEAGLKTLVFRPPTDHIPSRAMKSGAEQWIVRSWEDMDEGLRYLQHDGEEWDWVWLDSISGWQDTGLDDIWAGVLAEHPHRRQYSYDKGEYRINMNRLGEWIRHTTGVGTFHFGVTAWSFETVNPFNPDAMVLQRWPWIQGKGMPQRITGYMNFVGHMTVMQNSEQEWRRMYTQMTPTYFAKDQFDAFPKGYVDNPTMPQVLAAIEAARIAPAAGAGTPVKRGRGRGKPQPIASQPTTTKRRGRGAKKGA